MDFTICQQKTEVQEETECTDNGEDAEEAEENEEPDAAEDEEWATYEMVEDEEELISVSKVFEQLMDDINFEVEQQAGFRVR